MNLDGWGWDWDWRELASNLSVVEQTRKAFNSGGFTAAEELLAKEPGIAAHFPVILIPGVSWAFCLGSPRLHEILTIYRRRKQDRVNWP